MARMLIAHALAVAVGLTGCDGCRQARKLVARELESPAEPTAKQLVKDELTKAAELAARACGLESSAGLDAQEVKIDSLTAGVGHATVTAKPIDPKPKQGVALDKALVCIAVVTIAFRHASTSDDTWVLYSLELSEVKTAGAEWKAPESKHHHHHH